MNLTEIMAGFGSPAKELPPDYTVYTGPEVELIVGRYNAIRASKAGKSGIGDSKRRPATQAKSIAAMAEARKRKAIERKKQGS